MSSVITGSQGLQEPVTLEPAILGVTLETSGLDHRVLSFDHLPTNIWLFFTTLASLCGNNLLLAIFQNLAYILLQYLMNDNKPAFNDNKYTNIS